MSRIFPGMDPYLESPAFWSDFHRRFIDDLAAAILEVLPDDYDARMDESLRVVNYDPEAPSSDSARFPDVTVTRDPFASSSSTSAATRGPVAVLDLEPATTIDQPVLHEVRDVWIEVRHRDPRDVVTVIEVLSPTNKIGRGRIDYLKKRSGLLDRGIHLVEIDLLLGGQRIELRRPMPAGDYYAFVTHVRHDPLRWSTDIYTWPIERRLPALPIPLRAPDADVAVALDPVFEQTWQRGRYRRVLRYQTPPTHLPAERHPWAAEQIQMAVAKA